MREIIHDLCPGDLILWNENGRKLAQLVVQVTDTVLSESDGSLLTLRKNVRLLEVGSTANVKLFMWSRMHLNVGIPAIVIKAGR
jgi:hypothetical protein